VRSKQQHPLGEGFQVPHVSKHIVRREEAEVRSLPVPPLPRLPRLPPLLCARGSQGGRLRF
jgi:hypothetical protein